MFSEDTGLERIQLSVFVCERVRGGVQVIRLRAREDTVLGMCLWERVRGGVRAREDTALGTLV